MEEDQIKENREEHDSRKIRATIRRICFKKEYLEEGKFYLYHNYVKK